MQQAASSVEKDAAHKEFVFAGGAGAITAARSSVLEFLNTQGISDEEEIDLTIALQEALANAVFHGCGNDPRKRIQCSVDVTPQQIDIAISDPGAGFDPSSSDMSEDGSNLSHHGRGILLMRSLVDELCYRRGGSELHMMKRRKRL